MEKQLINEIARIKELLSPNQLITESSIPAKGVRAIFKSLGEINFKKLFSFATEEDIKLIKSASNTKKTLEAIEATFEKLIKSVNWSSLAKDIIGNELFGKNFSKALNNEISKVGKGIKTKEEVIREFDNFFDAHSATKNLEDLKKSLMSEIESKLDDVIKKIPDTSGVLSQEAEAIFLAAGKKMSSKQAEFLNGIAKKIDKLTPTELLQANNELKNIAAGTVQDAITRLSQAKDIISKTKAENYQKILDKVKDYLNISSKAVGGVNKTYLVKAILTIVSLCFIMGVWQWLKTTWVGKKISEGGGAISDTVLPGDTTTPENETTPEKPDNSGEDKVDWSKYK
jgi:hypothetical protein